MARLFDRLLVSLFRVPPAVPRAETRHSAPDVHVLAPELEKTLKENIAAFWYPRCLDTRNGGYTIRFGPRGESKGPGTKMIVTQARMVWFFSALARAGYSGPGWGTAEMLTAAETGYAFLRDQMWDPKQGGFYWEVSTDGTRQPQPAKFTYGQAFALYAISEYYLATRREDVLQFAVRVFDLLEDKAHDQTHGGYIEGFQHDWTPWRKATPPGPPDTKTMNTHLHLMESMTSFYSAGHLPKARERLLELIAIQSNTVVRKDVGACTDRFDLDWRRRPENSTEGSYGRVSFGHNLENIWLLMDANAAAGVPISLSMELYRTLFGFSLRHGYDGANGGFFESGRPGDVEADKRDKIWWVQAEALISALRMHQATGDPSYLEVFERTWAFIKDNLVDWLNGEWHERVTSGGKAIGDKGTIWKGAYHNGRAMMECLRLLKR